MKSVIFALALVFTYQTLADDYFGVDSKMHTIELPSDTFRMSNIVSCETEPQLSLMNMNGQSANYAISASVGCPFMAQILGLVGSSNPDTSEMLKARITFDLERMEVVGVTQFTE